MGVQWVLLLVIDINVRSVLTYSTVLSVKSLSHMNIVLLSILKLLRVIRIKKILMSLILINLLKTNKMKNHRLIRCLCSETLKIRKRKIKRNLTLILLSGTKKPMKIGSNLLHQRLTRFKFTKQLLKCIRVESFQRQVWTK